MRPVLNLLIATQIAFWIVICPPSVAQESKARHEHTRACLQGNGINPDASVAELAPLLARSDASALCVSNALLQEEPSPLIDNALLEATRSSDESKVEATTRALACHGNLSWADAVIVRLPKMESELLRVRIAATLALGERFERWPVIQEVLTRKEQNKYLSASALMAARNFVGMKGPSVRQVSLSDVLRGLLPIAPNEIHAGILTAMAQVDRMEKADPAKRNGK